MTTPIQAVPRGLLAALEAKGIGQNPAQLAEVVSGTFELEPYFLASRLEVIEATSLAQSAVNSEAAISVPPGEYWRLVGIAGRVDLLTVGALPEFGVGFRTSPPTASTGFTQLCDQSPVRPATVDADDQRWAGWTSPYPLVLGPGAQISTFLIADLNVGTCRIRTRCLFYRLVGG